MKVSAESVIINGRNGQTITGFIGGKNNMSVYFVTAWGDFYKMAMPPLTLYHGMPERFVKDIINGWRWARTDPATLEFVGP